MSTSENAELFATMMDSMMRLASPLFENCIELLEEMEGHIKHTEDDIMPIDRCDKHNLIVSIQDAKHCLGRVLPQIRECIQGTREGISIDTLRSMRNKRNKKSIVNDEEEFNERQSRCGWVYVIQADNGLYKIGKTKDWDGRLNHFTVKLPYELVFIMRIETEDRHELESFLHEQYSDKRIRGEWFRLDDDDIEVLRHLPGAILDKE